MLKKIEDKWNKSGYRLASIKKGNKVFEILVNSKKAWEFSQKLNKFKDNNNNIMEPKKVFQKIGIDYNEIVENSVIYSDIHKSLKSSNDDLLQGFNTIDSKLICIEILINGTIQYSKIERKKKKSLMKKQLVKLICNRVKNPKTNRPYTRKRILKALKRIKYHININEPIDKQFDNAISELRRVLPISVNSKIN